MRMPFGRRCERSRWGVASISRQLGRRDRSTQCELPLAPLAHRGLTQLGFIHSVSLAAIGVRTADSDGHRPNSPEARRFNDLLTRRPAKRAKAEYRDIPSRRPLL